ncbi:MAG: Holliday junction branch migration DNA helicase RuvB [Anaerolineales bacterium]|nr:Holliday junction branch migration DNA helicase RuvB [Anaerolineales bacterium]
MTTAVANTAAPQAAQINERNFRPTLLDDFIGQIQLKHTLRIMLNSARKRHATMEHVAFFGGPGLGKTTLASIVAGEMNSRMHEVAAPSLRRPGDLASVLTMLQKGDVLFLDECHALPREVSETLYSAMEDFKVTIQIEKDGSGARPPIIMALHPFTLIGSTTDFGLLPEPMRARFGQSFHLQLYAVDELMRVVERAADKLGYFTEEASLSAIAQRSRGTPRTALRLLRRCVDVAVSRDEDFIDLDLVEQTMPLLGLDNLGLEIADRQYLTTLVETYRGGPAGVRAIAANAGLDKSTIEQVVEPALLMMGLIARTPRGRRVTRKGHDHYKTFAANTVALDWNKVEAADLATN